MPKLNGEGFDAISTVSNYLETGDPLYHKVKEYARGPQGTVDREDLLTELLTSYFEKTADSGTSEVSEAMTLVYNVMGRAGYRPVDQLVGYLLSGDPSYITKKENAKRIISKIDKYEIITELMTSYFS